MKGYFAALLLILGVGCKNMASTQRITSERVYRPGFTVKVSLSVKPDADTLAYGVEERPPTGWAIKNVGEGGNNAGGVVKFGPFLDGKSRVLTYELVPPKTQAHGYFTGEASYNGNSIGIWGVRVLKYDLIPPKSPVMQ